MQLPHCCRYRALLPGWDAGVSTSIAQAVADLPITAGIKTFPEPEEELEASRTQFVVMTWWCLDFVRVCGAHKVPQPCRILWETGVSLVHSFKNLADPLAHANLT